MVELEVNFFKKK